MIASKLLFILLFSFFASVSGMEGQKNPRRGRNRKSLRDLVDKNPLKRLVKSTVEDTSFVQDTMLVDDQTEKDAEPEKKVTIDQIALINKAKHSIEKGDMDALSRILSTQAIDFDIDKNDLTSASFALLMYAIKQYRIEMCEMLLQAGANPNASSIEHPEGNTVLSEAISESFFPKSRVLKNRKDIAQICTLLIKHGAEITDRCRYLVQCAESKQIYSIIMKDTQSN